MRKPKFNYEAFADGLNAQCVTAVNKQMNKEILLTMSDLYHMAIVLKRFDRAEFNLYITKIHDAFDEAKLDYVETDKGLKHRGIATMTIDSRMQWILIMAVEATGNDKEQFNLCRYMIDWYGIERARAKVFKEFIPEDNRTRYAEDSYCGTTREEFIFDHVGLSDEDKNTMTLAVENNKWMMDQLIP